ncbi:PTS sugar transporter subunit IIA [Vibrio sp. SA48]
MKFKDSLVVNDSILLNYEANDWQDAIKIGTDMLERAGAVTDEYYSAILESVYHNGPYFIIAPGLAMPHARPEKGVRDTAFALVTLREPVLFDTQQVEVLITLAAKDSDSHIEAMQDIAQAIEDENSETGINLDRFKECKSPDDVILMLSNIES